MKRINLMKIEVIDGVETVMHTRPEMPYDFYKKVLKGEGFIENKVGAKCGQVKQEDGTFAFPSNK